MSEKKKSQSSGKSFAGKEKKDNKFLQTIGCPAHILQNVIT